ncbi:RagB/SusD family nutrient uptake outer membrane protein [Flammeovirga sp. SubArs3]|uniref:RagB/SusD family nutrient uptake outer membrane protein n=1 Tax=Flammeovirga sp. SubArs3 TaxID=2995316 RepID=UPI00248C41E4|nr:RagB/SusD family nutrient uptake outer membrane protein [Flammeovirga sp. SubArs3]
MKYIKQIFIAVMMLGATSCSEFLEYQPSTEVSPDVAFESLDNAKATLVGAYDQLSSPYFDGLYVPIMNDVMGEDLMINSDNNWGWFVSVYQMEMLANYQWVTNPWAVGYKVIYDANMIIHNTPNIPKATESEKAELIAQAKALRAYCYLHLIQMYADSYHKAPEGDGVILRTIPAAAEDEDFGRASTQEVYDQIIEDLSYAVENMTESDYKGFLDQRGAQALLARTYLLTENWEKASEYAEQAYTGLSLMTVEEMWGGFMLFDNNPEAIFYLDYTRTDNNIYLSLPSFYWPEYGYSSIRADEVFLDKFDDADIRKGFFTFYEPIDADNYLILKFGHNEALGNAHMIKIRASEMYLIKAEAEAELGNDEAAIEAVYEVMKRANGGAVKPTASGEELVNVILEERRRELFGEGFRWFDIKRRNQAFVREGQHWAKWNFGPEDNDYYRLTFPIPQGEIDSNTEINEENQNQGY